MFLRSILEDIESKGDCYSGRLRSGDNGVCWLDEERGRLYEYKTNDESLSVDDLKDEELDDIDVHEL
jgi:hypothetical protein